MFVAIFSLPSQPGKKRWAMAGMALLLVYVGLIGFTFRDYGMSWDQPTSHEYGDAVVRFYTSRGANHSAQTHHLRSYGGFFEVVANVVERGTGLPWFEARNLSSALFGLIGLVSVMRLGWIAFGSPVGVIAAGLLACTPVYYGHQFINPKDLPFAAMYVLALRYIVGLVIEYPGTRWSTVIKLGLAIGAALAIRVGGLVLFGALGVASVTSVALACWQDRRPNRSQSFVLFAQASAVVVVAWCTMVLFWPLGWSNPWDAPLIALDEFAQFAWDGEVFYNGALLHPSDLPWSYIPNLMMRTLPEPILLGLMGGLAISPWVLMRGRIKDWGRSLLVVITLICAVLLPVITIWNLHSNVYDGLRHVLFIIPPFVLLAASGTWALLSRLQPFAARATWVGVLWASLLMTGRDMCALHPYEYIYFNRSLAGGLSRANEQYDLDYWATGLKEAAEWAASHYRPLTVKEVSYSVPEAETLQVSSYLKPSPASGTIFRLAAAGEKPRLVFLIRRRRQTMDPDFGHLLHTVKRMGVPLVDVVENP